MAGVSYAEDGTRIVTNKDEITGATAKKNKQYRPHIHGRIMLDGATYQPGSTPLGAGTDISSARLSVSGRADADWRYRLDYELSGSGSLKSAYLSRKLAAHQTLTIGNYQVPFSLEELTGSSSKTFMERGLPNTFAPSYRPSLGISYRRRHMSIAASLFGDSQNAGGPASKTSGNEGGGAALRLTYLTRWNARHLFHVGASSYLRVPNADNTARFRSRPEARLNVPRLIDTTKISNVARSSVSGFETALVLGPLSLQGEYMRAVISRKTGLSAQGLSGWYAYISYFLTGESRPYTKSAAFGKVVPEAVSGAWEIAIRRSALDLNSTDIHGGVEYNTTLGLNYYLSPKMRVMANYLLINVKAYPDGFAKPVVKESPKAFTVRMQMVF